MRAYLMEELGLPEETALAILERVSAESAAQAEALDYANGQLAEVQQAFAEHRKHAHMELLLTKSGAKNISAAMALIDKSAVCEEDGAFSGAEEQVANVKEMCPYLFRTELSGGMQHKVPQEVDAFTQYARQGARLGAC